MAENELYSAYHWAKKAEKFAAESRETRTFLDKLWDDIDAGLLGEEAKTGFFYTSYPRSEQ